MSYAKVCAQCERHFISRRPDAETDSEECKYQRWIETNLETPQPVTHPLQLVREEQAEKKHNRDLGGLIRQAIVDTIKTTGSCHADDLIPLYPASEVDRCRRLATAQFGSLCAPREGHEPQLVEKERRKSSIPERKGAKSGVYVFTKYGRETLVGSCADTPGGVKVAESPASSHSVPHVGAASSQDNENVGLSAAAQLGGPAESGRSIEPGDLTLDAGHSQGKSDQGGALSSSVARIETPEPPEVLQLEIPQESGSSAYGVVVEDAA